MRTRKLHLVSAVVMVTALTAAPTVHAQTGVVHDAPVPPANQLPADAPALNQSAPTLEVPPRLIPPPAAAPSPSPSGDTSAIAPGADVPDTDDSAAAEPKRPYLGMSIQYIQSDATPGREVRGLEVVGVDPDSPAEHAGLRPRGAMTNVGATGATAGALVPPLDLVVMPLLKKSGQLGAPGDLIVAIDDQRINSEADLQDVLDQSKPGDTIYFTVVRSTQGGGHDTLKVPVRLGDPNGDIAKAGQAAPLPDKAPQPVVPH
jgi:PDZ domain-containing protein